MIKWYTLDEHMKPILTPTPTYEERWHTEDYIYGVRISTVFLGLDHNQYDGGPPVLFETMIFGGPEDQFQQRYCTYEEALAGHTACVARIRAAGIGGWNMKGWFLEKCDVDSA